MYGELEAGYSELSGYLVFSDERGQAEVRSTTAELAGLFSEMIVESAAKRRYLELANRIAEEGERLAISTGKERQVIRSAIQDLRETFAAVEKDLEIDPEVRIEIRFKRLRYREVVWPLQEDPRVDRTRTPQNRANIRIVLGTVGELYRKGGVK